MTYTLLTSDAKLSAVGDDMTQATARFRHVLEGEGIPLPYQGAMLMEESRLVDSNHTVEAGAMEAPVSNGRSETNALPQSTTPFIPGQPHAINADPRPSLTEARIRGLVALLPEVEELLKRRGVFTGQQRRDVNKAVTFIKDIGVWKAHQG